MDVSTISVPRDTAIQKINSIEALKRSQRTEEDDALLALFKAVRKHNSRVVDIGKAFQQTGLNELGQPKLAIARGDWKDVAFAGDGPARNEQNPWRWLYRSGKFFEQGRPSDRVSTVKLPNGTFPEFDGTKMVFSPVPHVPAEHRPAFHLRNYHILFEVEKWTAYPVDPFLLKHIAGNVYVVLAEWDLTDVEASILGGMHGGN